jgi:hypothetical protein
VSTILHVPRAHMRGAHTGALMPGARTMHSRNVIRREAARDVDWHVRISRSDKFQILKDFAHDVRVCVCVCVCVCDIAHLCCCSLRDTAGI